MWLIVLKLSGTSVVWRVYWVFTAGFYMTNPMKALLNHVCAPQQFYWSKGIHTRSFLVQWNFFIWVSKETFCVPTPELHRLAHANQRRQWKVFSLRLTRKPSWVSLGPSGTTSGVSFNYWFKGIWMWIIERQSRAEQHRQTRWFRSIRRMKLWTH